MFGHQWNAYLHVLAAVLGAKDKGGQAAGQLQSAEKPHQIPENNGVVVHDGWWGDNLLTLVLQEALQLLPQHQRTQVGHGDWLLVQKNNTNI